MHRPGSQSPEAASLTFSWFLGSFFSTSLNSRKTLLFVDSHSEALSTLCQRILHYIERITRFPFPILQIQSCCDLCWMNSQSPGYYDEVNAIHGWDTQYITIIIHFLWNILLNFECYFRDNFLIYFPCLLCSSLSTPTPTYPWVCTIFST